MSDAALTYTWGRREEVFGTEISDIFISSEQEYGHQVAVDRLVERQEVRVLEPLAPSLSIKKSLDGSCQRREEISGTCRIRNINFDDCKNKFVSKKNKLKKNQNIKF